MLTPGEVIETQTLTGYSSAEAATSSSHLELFPSEKTPKPDGVPKVCPAELYDDLAHDLRRHTGRKEPRHEATRACPHGEAHLASSMRAIAKRAAAIRDPKRWS